MRLRTDQIFTTPIMYVKLTDEPIFQDIVDVLNRINDPNLEDHNMTKSHEIASKAGSRQYKIKIHAQRGAVFLIRYSNANLSSYKRGAS